MNESANSLQEHLRPEQVRQRLEELDAILEGHFQLSSGMHSDKYFQCARVLQYPDLARELGRLLGERVDELEIDLVMSPAVGGIVIAHEVARAIGRRHVFCERRQSGMELRRGFEIRKGERALLVDDVLTRGTSFGEMERLVSSHEAQAHGIAVIVDRRAPDVQIPATVTALLREDVQTYPAEACPLCDSGLALSSPGSRHGA